MPMTSTTDSPNTLLKLADSKPLVLGGGGVDAERLGWPTLGLYGVGGLAESVVAFGLGQLLLFYLTIVCGLSGSAAGFAMGAAVVVDAATQPFVGLLSDNSRSKHGRRHPFMVVGAIPLAVGFGLLYSIPTGVTGAPLFLFVLAALLAIRLAQAVFNVPYMALGAELSEDYQERSLVVASRLLCGSLGSALAIFLAYGVFMKGHAGQTHRDAYAPFAWTCVVVIVLGTGISILGTLRARDRLRATGPNQGTSFLQFLSELGKLIRNPSFRTLFCMALFFQVAWSAASALGLHANTYFWKLPTSQILSVNLLGVIGFLAGCVLAATIARFVSKRTTSMIGMGLIGICQLSLAPLRLAGVIHQEDVLLSVTLSTMLSQMGLSMTLVGYQSMMADAADEHEQLFGARRQGLYYAGTALAAFASSGIGAIIAGVSLDVIKFPHGIAKLSAPVIPAETIRDLGLVYGPAMGLLTVVAIVVLFGYRLTKDGHAAIRVSLAQRREQAESGS